MAKETQSLGCQQQHYGFEQPVLAVPLPVVVSTVTTFLTKRAKHLSKGT